MQQDVTLDNVQLVAPRVTLVPFSCFPWHDVVQGHIQAPLNCLSRCFRVTPYSRFTVLVVLFHPETSSSCMLSEGCVNVVLEWLLERTLTYAR